MRLLTVAVPDPVVRAQQVAIGAWFLYVFLPQVPIYVLAMVMTGVLHAHRRFLAPAAAPLFSSLIVIAGYLTFGALGAGADLNTVTPLQRYVLAGATTAGVGALALSQVPSFLRTGVRWRPVLGWGDPAVRRALRAGAAGIGYFAVTEIGLVITLLFANRVEGGVVAYRVGFAFFELPKALVGLPIAAVLLPSLSERFARSDEDGFARLFSQGWRAAFFLAAPAGIGLAVLGPTISEAILSRAPSGAAPGLVGAALRALGLGIPAFVLVEPLIRSFFARHRPRVPVLMNAAAVGVFAAILIPVTLAARPHGRRALEVIGFGNAVGQWVGVAAGVAILAFAVRQWDVRSDLVYAGVTLARAAAMGAVVYLVLRATHQGAVIESVLGLAVGGLTYLVLNVRSHEVQRTIRWLRSTSA